jgi:hypothetical protein
VQRCVVATRDIETHFAEGGGDLPILESCCSLFGGVTFGGDGSVLCLSDPGGMEEDEAVESLHELPSGLSGGYGRPLTSTTWVSSVSGVGSSDEGEVSRSDRVKAQLTLDIFSDRFATSEYRSCF